MILDTTEESPLPPGVRNAAESLTKQTEATIAAALTRADPSLCTADIALRCCVVSLNNVDTLYLDGKPILVMHPIETELTPKEGGYTFRVWREYQEL